MLAPMRITPASSRLRSVDLADVWNVARHFLRPKLRVAGFEFELLDVDGGVVVLLHHLFGDENRVLEVVAAPWHEGDEHVASQSQLAEVRARTVGDDLALHTRWPFFTIGFWLMQVFWFERLNLVS